MVARAHGERGGGREPTKGNRRSPRWGGDVLGPECIDARIPVVTLYRSFARWDKGHTGSLCHFLQPHVNLQ